MSESKTLPTRRHPRKGRTTAALSIYEFLILFALYIVIHSFLTAVGIPGMLLAVGYSIAYAYLVFVSGKIEGLRDRLWDKLYPGGQP